MTSEDTLKCHPQKRCPPPLRQGLWLIWTSPIWLGWLISKSHSPSCAHLSSTGIVRMCHHAPAFYTDTGNPHLGLQSCVHFTKGVSSPAPINCYLWHPNDRHHLLTNLPGPSCRLKAFPTSVRLQREKPVSALTGGASRQRRELQRPSLTCPVGDKGSKFSV